MRYLALLLIALPLFAVPDSVTIYDESGMTQTNRVNTISRVFAKGEIPHYPQAIVGGVALATQADVMTRWADNSAQHVMVSFVKTIAANGSITVTFQDQASGNNAGAMNQAAMLAATWDADIELTHATLTCTGNPISGGSKTCQAEARTMLGNGDWTYRLQGSIVTQVVVEGSVGAGTLFNYDMGWDTYKPLHPVFVLTFYPSSVQVEYIVENAWTTKYEDNTYSVVLKAGSPLSSVYTHASWTQGGATSWKKSFWSGTAQGAVHNDLNFPYMTFSQVLPNWDTSQTVPITSDSGSCGINAYALTCQWQAWNNTGIYSGNDQCDLGGTGLWNTSWGAPGAHLDLGPVPVWYIYALQAMSDTTWGPRFDPILTGQADCGGNPPYIFREAAAGLFYDASNTINAQGLPISLNAHPTDDPFFSGCGAPVCGSGGAVTSPWSLDYAHIPSMLPVPYMVTGDYYYLRTLQAAAHQYPLSSFHTFDFYARGEKLGIINIAQQHRGMAWQVREMMWADFFTPSGNIRNYLDVILDNQIAFREGFYGITGGSFPPANSACPGYSGTSTNATAWCFGRYSVDSLSGNGSVGSPLANPLHFATVGADGTGGECGISVRGFISTSTWSGGSATVTMPSNFITGAGPSSSVYEYDISGVSVSGFNTINVVPTSVSNTGFPTTFTYTIANPGGTGSGGYLDMSLYALWPADRTTPALPCSRGDSSLEEGYELGVWGQLQELGYPVTFVNQFLFSTLVWEMADPATNPFLCCIYKIPVVKMDQTNFTQTTYYQTPAEYLAGFRTDGQCIDGGSLIGPLNWQTMNDFRPQCSGATSSSEPTDTADPGFPRIIRGVSAYLTQFNVNWNSDTGTAAQNWVYANVPACSMIVICGENIQYAILPRGVTPPPPPTITTSGKGRNYATSGAIRRN
jgi:hypothetical protein